VGLLLALILTAGTAGQAVPVPNWPNCRLDAGMALGWNKNTGRPECGPVTGSGGGGGSPTALSSSSSLVVATSDGGSGYDLSTPLYETTAALTLYLDATGNDSNACTGSGASACLTWAGIRNRLPRNIRHTTIINLGAGTSTGVLDLSGVSVGAALTVAGTLSNFTPATGTATGTATSVSYSATAETVINDTGQTWTVNDLRGRFITIGGFTIPIVSNTATSINVVFNQTIAAGAYSIRTPASIISTGATAPIVAGALVGMSTNALSAVTISNVDFQTTALLRIESQSGRLTFTNCRFVTTNTFSAITGDNLVFFSNYVQADTGVNFTKTTAGNTTLIGGYFRIPGSGAFTVRSAGAVTISSTVIERTAYTTQPLAEFAISNGQSSYSPGGVLLALKCPAGDTNVALRARSADGTVNGIVSGANNFRLSAVRIENCATGIRADGRGTSLRATAAVFTGVATPLSVNEGALIRVETLPTASGATTEATVDGDPYTFAAIDALSPKVVTNLSTQSLLGLQ
jgi:hypothetical protein